ncbi:MULTISPECIES: 5-formyltetrahydrofolate cyclo-ligase [unclassified Caballeronia]|uniref:5-formyltetrahydrofolate cyclo-ligase n=1 Tax=unclassified Caballeronia TaxID=2646786 RepID=UPI001F346D83|nr:MULTISPECIES: 5-formyltetrahydrofolate cyclo-ligase [unclassified Caballeronia]MCE4543483.1 5-formyltetrahydrofolate cyclo-ligase [Caballeronia sp. PC1]MCE4567461.1 5-formyltetrahydrofolate cyclo-ligase [Caballeronia sp. CLC5]
MVLNRVLRSEESIARNVCDQPKSEPKSALRATLLATREAQSEQAGQIAKNAALAARIEEVLARHDARCVGLYWPVAGEFDARAAMTRWLAADAARGGALPVVVKPHAPMVFHAWSAHMPMKEGRYRIPVPAEERVVVPELLLIPCVGFDAHRYRLGYGGGYYDRTLAAWPDAKRPVTIGIAYESGKCGVLPRETHDMPLDAIVTESAIY